VVEERVPGDSRDIARILCRTLLGSYKSWRHSRCCGMRPNRSSSAKPTL
jgi:hypothetical protein